MTFGFFSKKNFFAISGCGVHKSAKKQFSQNFHAGMKQLDLADVVSMCPLHDFVLSWLGRFGFTSLMLYREEGKPESEFRQEMALCLQEILEEYGPLGPEDIEGQVDRAVVIVDCNDRIVACLTYDCQEFTGSPPVLSMVVKHFAIAQLNESVCEQVR